VNMADQLEMSLEQISAASRKSVPKTGGGGSKGGAKASKGGRGRGAVASRGRGRGSKGGGKSYGGAASYGGGAARRGRSFGNNRSTPYSTGIRRTVVVDPMEDYGDEEDDYDDFGADQVLEEEEDPQPRAALATGTTVQVSNLDQEVTDADIEELFTAPIKGSNAPVALKSFQVNYNRSGESQGTATVVFARRSDAMNAIKEYNNVPLDGKPMQLAMVGAVVAPAPKPAARIPMSSRVSMPQRSSPASRMQPRNRDSDYSGNNYSRGRGSTGRKGGKGNGKGSGKGGGRGRGGKVRESATAEDLDNDLESYKSMK